MTRNPFTTLTRIFIIYGILFLTVLSAKAQIEQRVIDSLQVAAQNASQDTTRIATLFKLGESLWFNRRIPDAVIIFKQVIDLSDKKNYYRHSCNAQLLLSHAYIRVEKFDSALQVLRTALDCSLNNNQPEHIPKIDQAYCLLYERLGDHARAIDYGLKAASGYEQSPVQEINIQSIFAWMDVGGIFEEQGQTDKALTYYQKALRKAEDTGKEWFIKAPKLRVAAIYLQQGLLTDAKKIFEEVIAIDRTVGGAEPTMEGLVGLGHIALREKNIPAAIGYYKAALDTATHRNFLREVDRYTAYLGRAFFEAGNTDSAYRYYVAALDGAISGGDVTLQKEVYEHLAELEIQKGNLNKALSYRQQVRSLSDSLYNTERVRAVNNLEILYETSKKEKEIVLLNTEKKLAILQRNRFLLIGGVVAVALLAILGLLYRNNRQKRVIAEKEKQLQQDEIKLLQEQQQVISLQSMINGEEAERTRIARDLHDGLGGLFSTVKMYLSTLQHDVEGLKENQLFEKSYALVDDASVEVRRIAHNMMPETLLQLGLVDAVRDMCNNISAAKLLRITLQVYGMEERLTASTEIMLYRIIQELLNNIIKHAHATEAIIQFNRGADRFTVTVEDNGRGFNTEASDGKMHAGLGTVQNRVNYLNGKLSIESQQGMGTTVMMDFKL